MVRAVSLCRAASTASTPASTCTSVRPSDESPKDDKSRCSGHRSSCRQRRVMRQVKGAGPVGGRGLFEFFEPRTRPTLELLLGELTQGFDGSGGFLPR